MGTVVLYKSKTGFVQKYAQWIAEELHADVFEASKVNADALGKYDTVIYGGGLYVGGINGVKRIKANLSRLNGKKVIVFASGASPSRCETIDEVRNHNFTETEQKAIRFFYLRGGFDFEKFGMVDRVLLRILKRSLEKKKERTPDENGMLSAYEHPVDFTNKKYIEELVTYARAQRSDS